MRDCWLSPYGEVIYVSAWSHNTKAEELLIERYGFEDIYDIYDKHPFETASDVLMKYGWIRYSTCANRGWLMEVKPSSEQKNKMFDLTGYVYDD
ncbi:MAG: hypothetical protein IJH39_05650 [Clostridia bacterium]|nr:hypothetical protein [Clostridia bacterium]